MQSFASFTVAQPLSSQQAKCIDSTAEPEAVFAGEVKKMQAEKMKPQEQVNNNYKIYKTFK